MRKTNIVLTAIF